MLAAGIPPLMLAEEVVVGIEPFDARLLAGKGGQGLFRYAVRASPHPHSDLQGWGCLTKDARPVPGDVSALNGCTSSRPPPAASPLTVDGERGLYLKMRSVASAASGRPS